MIDGAFRRRLTLVAMVCLSILCQYGELHAETGWVDVRDHKGDLTAAVTAARGRKILISIPTNTINGSLNLPADVQIEVVQGGVIVLAPSATITISGPFSAGLHQVFRGGGRTLFGAGSLKEVYPEWWGVAGKNDENAINAAIDAVSAGDVVLTRTYYIESAPVKMKSGITLKGAGRAISSAGIGAILYNRRASGAALFIGEYVKHITIENIGFCAATTKAGQYGIEMAGDAPRYSKDMLIKANDFYRLDKGIYAHELTYANGWECDHVEVSQNVFNECNIDIHLVSQNTDFWRIANNSFNYLDTGVYLERSGTVSLDTNAGGGVSGKPDNTFVKIHIFGPLTMINNQAEQTDWFLRNTADTGNPYPINMLGNSANAPCKIIGGGLIINSMGNFFSEDVIIDSGNTNITSTQDSFVKGKKFVLKNYSQIASLTSGATIKNRVNAADDQTANSVREMPIATTRDTQVAYLKPWNVRGEHLILYKVHYYYRVVKAATDVRLHLEYNDGTGHQDIDLVPSGMKGVGSYAGNDVTIGATSGTGTGGGIALKVKAGSPNQVYISATIEPITY
ncbi:hypothetical protein AOG1_24680 [Geobacter sp. AOG1]|nr:hypothetical protein AOG1_24680 [Geobacter sp. AOG1]